MVRKPALQRVLYGRIYAWNRQCCRLCGMDDRFREQARAHRRYRVLLHWMHPTKPLRERACSRRR